jgi:hypothetical protein
MIYPEILSGGLSDHYLILVLGFSNLFVLLKLGLKTIPGVLAQLKLQGGVNIKIRVMRRTGEVKHWRLSFLFLETLPERLRGD